MPRHILSNIAFPVKDLTFPEVNKIKEEWVKKATVGDIA